MYTLLIYNTIEEMFNSPPSRLDLFTLTLSTLTLDYGIHIDEDEFSFNEIYFCCW